MLCQSLRLVGIFSLCLLLLCCLFVISMVLTPTIGPTTMSPSMPCHGQRRGLSCSSYDPQVPFQVKIQAQNEEMLHTACQQFMGKSEAEIRKIAMETLEGHQRAIMGCMTVEVLTAQLM